MAGAAVEFNVLLECLRRSMHPKKGWAGVAPVTIPPELRWTVLLELAEQHAVLPLVYPLLSAQATPEFKAAGQHCWAHAQFIAADLEDVLEAFTRAGIEAMPIKGPALAESLFGDVAARASLDLDILVEPGQVDRARGVLQAIGFTAEEISKPIKGIAYDLPFRRDDTLVELHTAFGRPELCPLNAAAVWDRSRRDAFRWRPIRVMQPEDTILYLSYHMLRHDCSRLQWIVDLARALELLAKEGSGASLLRSAREQRMEELLFFASALAAETLQTPLPEKLEAALRARPHLIGRAHLFLKEGLDAPRGGAAQASWSFYSAEKSTMRRWARRLRELAPTEADRAWARSKHIPAGIAIPLLPLVRVMRVVEMYGVAGAWRNFLQGTR